MDEPLLEEAKKESLAMGYVSFSWLQRRLRIGYMRASSIVDKLIAEGFCEKEPYGAYRYPVAAQQMREPDSLKAGDSSLPDVVKSESNLPA